MIKKSKFKNDLFVLIHKFTRFTKQQKVFVLYIAALIFFLVLFPILKITPVDGNIDRVWLLSGAFFKTMVIIVVCLAVLAGWNMSFRFKNIVINYFGFKENDALFNFVLLWIISTAFFAISDTVNVVQYTTSTISVTGSYYIIEVLLVIGLILTVMTIVKSAKLQGSKTKIINTVHEDTMKDVSHKKTFKGLFDEEKEEEEILNIHNQLRAEEVETPHHTATHHENKTNHENHGHNQHNTNHEHNTHNHN